MAYRRTSRTQRAKRYWYLRRRRLSPVEALAFSQLTRKYPALKSIVRERGYQWQAFKAEAKAKGWLTDYSRRIGWSRWLVDFYSKRRYAIRGGEKTVITWIVRKDRQGRPLKQPKISPWDWYDAIFARLPEELKWDTPRSGRRAKQPDVDINKVQAQKQRRQWIADLRRTIEREPWRKVELEKQIRRLGGRP